MSKHQRNQTEILMKVLGVSAVQIDLAHRLYEDLPPLSKEIVQLSFDGASLKQIASQLNVSETTVRTYKHKLMYKLEKIFIEQTVPPKENDMFRLDKETEIVRPPINAEYLLYLLLPKADQDCEIGDLIERYGRLARKFNKRRANVWYYWQVAGFGFSCLRRVVFKIGGVIWLGRILRRLIS